MAIAKVFFDVQANLGLPGLAALIQERKVKVGAGNYVMFMNRKRTRVKIMFDETTLFAYSKGSDHPITLEELRNLPKVCKGEWVDKKTAETVATWLEKPVSSNTSMVKVA